MLQTPHAIDEFSDRIERAYLCHRSQWRPVNLDPRVWQAAVGVLVEAHRIDPRAPLDPELFVACVARGSIGGDPWTDLTRTSSLRRYLSRVRSILRQLRKEIRAEIRRIRKRVRGGETLESVLLGASQMTTAIARYLVAIREDRPDLADLLLDRAQDQHWCCPLYREATLTLFPAGTYPVPSHVVEDRWLPKSPAFSLN